MTEHLQVGRSVEVVGFECGFLGSFYEAQVIANEHFRHFRVQYKTLLSENGRAPLEEVVPLCMLHPIPPPIYVDVYENGQTMMSGLSRGGGQEKS